MRFYYSKRETDVPYTGDPENFQYCISRERRIEIAILDQIQKETGKLLESIS